MNRYLVSIVFLFSMLGASQPTSAAPSSFAQLKKQYLHLRNTDSHINHENEWRDLLKQSKEFAAKDAGGDGATVLLNAARMYIALYNEKKNDEDLEQAEILGLEVADQYPKSQSAPDALILVGDLFLNYKQDEKKAKKYFQRIINQYPSSELVEYAKGKIEQSAENAESSDHKTLKKDDSLTGPVIVLDPGHGGEDFGAVGVSGLMEKDVTLDIAFILEKILQQKLHAKVILTRRGDAFVPLQKRTEMANDADAQIFVSLHNNSSESAKLSGFETYYLDSQGDQSSKMLAERENAAGGDAPTDDISFMISDLIQTSKIPESATLAQSIQKQAIKVISDKWTGAKSLKVKKAPFYVLVGAHMPAVLVEMFFINNAVEGSRLADRAFRENIALGIFQGISSYLSQ